MDDHWNVRLGDPEKLRNATGEITFDVPAAPDTLFTDPELELDLLTGKLLLYHSVKEGIIGSAAVAGIFARNYLQFVRWRLGIGIYRNADLTEAVLNSLRNAIAAHGVVGLPPVKQAFEAAKHQVEAGTRTLPSYSKGGRMMFGSDAFLRELGVPNMTSVPPTIRKQIRELALAHGLHLNSSAGGEAADEDIIPTRNRVAAFLKPIQALHTFAHHLAHDRISFVPFGGETPQAVANSITAREANRTFTVPALQACHLIDQSITWVTQYGPDILQFLNLVEQRAAQLTGPDGHWRPHERAIHEVAKEFRPSFGVGQPGSPWPIHPAYFEANRGDRVRPSLRTVLFDYLLVACVVVIAAFAARRREEINSLRDDCLVEVDGDLLLRSYIEKTIRDIEEIPVPSTVKCAVEVLIVLSRKRRERTGERWIVTFDEALDVRSGKGETQPVEALRSGQIDFYRTLSKFSTFVGTPTLRDGTVWSPKPHEFRKWFGTTYYNRYRFPQLLALAHFYRHFDPNVTRAYITEKAHGGFIKEKDENRARARRLDRDRLRDFDATGFDFRLERFLDVAEGRETLTGFGGQYFAKEIRGLVAHYADRLVGADRRDREQTLIEAIAPLAKSTRLEPNGQGHTYCKCRSTAPDLAAAKCLQIRAKYDQTPASGPDSTYASDTTCGGCPHGVRFSENRTFMDEIIMDIEGDLASGARGSAQEFQQQRLNALKAHRDLFGQGPA